MDPLSSRAARLAADLLCPERCAACPALVPSAHVFCRACQTHVNVLGPPECAHCGAPLAPGSARAHCPPTPNPPIRQVRAWGAYRGDGELSPLAKALAAFKYHGALRLARRLAASMVPRIPDPAVAVVVPVPLHPRKLRARGYNQSAVLARHIARALGRPTTPSLLRRTRDTPSQTALSARARAANVTGAFAVAQPERVLDLVVLLVDDVWTSGATARAAAAALRGAGARAVDVITLARVL